MLLVRLFIEALVFVLVKEGAPAGLVTDVLFLVFFKALYNL